MAAASSFAYFFFSFSAERTSEASPQTDEF
jgi:hypothetical protein